MVEEVFCSVGIFSGPGHGKRFLLDFKDKSLYGFCMFKQSNSWQKCFVLGQRWTKHDQAMVFDQQSETKHVLLHTMWFLCPCFWSLVIIICYPKLVTGGLISVRVGP